MLKEIDEKAIEIGLKKRTRLERILLAPKHLIGQYRIGRRSQNVFNSFYCAWVLTLLLIKN